MSKQPTIQSVTEGLARLIREVRHLQSEVARLTHTLNGFTDKYRETRRWYSLLPPEANPDQRDAARAETDEPKSAIRTINYEFNNNANLDIPTRTLLAISKEIDGALRDIRAARNDIEAITDDSDLRDDFREWQANQRS